LNGGHLLTKSATKFRAYLPPLAGGTENVRFSPPGEDSPDQSPDELRQCAADALLDRRCFIAFVEGKSVSSDLKPIDGLPGGWPTATTGQLWNVTVVSESRLESTGTPSPAVAEELASFLKQNGIKIRKVHREASDTSDAAIANEVWLADSGIVVLVLDRASRLSNGVVKAVQRECFLLGDPAPLIVLEADAKAADLCHELRPGTTPGTTVFRTAAGERNQQFKQVLAWIEEATKNPLPPWYQRLSPWQVAKRAVYVIAPLSLLIAAMLSGPALAVFSPWFRAGTDIVDPAPSPLDAINFSERVLRTGDLQNPFAGFALSGDKPLETAMAAGMVSTANELISEPVGTSRTAAADRQRKSAILAWNANSVILWTTRPGTGPFVDYVAASLQPQNVSRDEAILGRPDGPGRLSLDFASPRVDLNQATDLWNLRHQQIDPSPDDLRFASQFRKLATGQSTGEPLSAIQGAKSLLLCGSVVDALYELSPEGERGTRWILKANKDDSLVEIWKCLQDPPATLAAKRSGQKDRAFNRYSRAHLAASVLELNHLVRELATASPSAKGTKFVDEFVYDPVLSRAVIDKLVQVANPGAAPSTPANGTAK
jgi:hypothetical protein